MPMGKKEYMHLHPNKTEKDYKKYVEDLEKANIEGCNACNAEAVRVVKSLPRFAPAKQQGKAILSWFTLPIRFQLQ